MSCDEYKLTSHSIAEKYIYEINDMVSLKYCKIEITTETTSWMFEDESYLLLNEIVKAQNKLK